MAELLINQLRAGYARTHVLDDITLRLSSGMLHALLGPNGTGKSTLLRAIAGVIPLRGGALRWSDGAEHDLTRLTPLQRAGYIAYVPQLAANDLPLTVLESIQIAARAASRGRMPDPLKTLQSLGLGQLQNTLCSQLSGGLWRRVLLAQGLAQAAPILLVDEPTAFLDPPARHEVLAMLRRLAETEDLCCVCVLHDPALSLTYAHTVSAISGGRVLASGASAEVITPENLRLLYGSAVSPALHSSEEVFLHVY
jgi:iron complex transport system ATP-binding protein